MVAFSLIIGLPLGLTPSGTAAVVLTGALYGLPGGALCWVLDRHVRLRAAPRAAVGGMVLFVGIAAVSIPNNQAAAALERPILSTVLFLPLAIAFAAVVQRAPVSRLPSAGET